MQEKDREEDEEQLTFREKVILYACCLFSLIVPCLLGVIVLSKSHSDVIGLLLVFAGMIILLHFDPWPSDDYRRELSRNEKIFAAIAGLLICTGLVMLS